LFGVLISFATSLPEFSFLDLTFSRFKGKSMSLVRHLSYTKKIMFQFLNTEKLFGFSYSIVNIESAFSNYVLSTIVSKGNTSLIFHQGNKLCYISCHVTRELTVNNPLIFTLLCMKCHLHKHGFIFVSFLICFRDCWAFISLNFLEVNFVEFCYMPKIIAVITYDVIIQQRVKTIIISSSIIHGCLCCCSL
jgi:hypothetical protein